jgi:hypothetical protein
VIARRNGEADVEHAGLLIAGMLSDWAEGQVRLTPLTPNLGQTHDVGSSPEPQANEVGTCGPYRDQQAGDYVS